jgi:phosphoglycerate dehydrogenase-like enzyme
MKILYTPLMIVPSLSAEQRAGILEAAGPGTVLVEAKEPARQRAEIVDTDILFGRVAPDIFVLNRRLRFYHSIGAGVDAVLSPELVQSDIPLASEKGGVGIHLAEHAFALLLGLTRGLHTAIRRPDYGLREPIRLEQRELFESTMGIVGFGGVGREVARRALAFGMRVIGVDIEDVPPEPGVPDIWKTDRLYEMLGLSDVVVIGLPLTKATRHLFTRDLFRRMRRTAILINVTRGEIIYGEDLLAALDEGLIWGAGLDVTDPEPLPPGHPLWSLPNCIITPHVANTPEMAQPLLAERIVQNVKRFARGEELIGPVDPELGY